MMPTFKSRKLLRTAVATLLIGAVVVPTITGASVIQVVHAQRVAAAVTTTAITYRFDAQVAHGAKAGAGVHGWLSGVQDSLGVITATLTAGGLTPLTPGCAPHTEFGPACGLPPSANVAGQTKGRGASAIATLTAAGKGWTWILAGAAVGTAGQWTGTLTQGSAYIGTWSLTPAPTAVTIYMGGRSDPKSAAKMVIAAAIHLYVTADGWAIGTFAPLDGTPQTVVQGYVNANSGSASLSIPMGSKGAVLATGWSRKGFGNLNWKGIFVGPAAGDYGSWTGQG